jgi:anti-sigma regulatory factor (Ser/Thr protein kinase)
MQPVVLGCGTVILRDDGGNFPEVDYQSIQQIRFCVCSNPRNIARTVACITRFAQRLPFNRENLTFFIIAVSEAVQNAILYAPNPGVDVVEVNLMYIPHVYLLVGITDANGSVPLRCLCAEPGDIPADAEHGRGLYTMRMFSSLFVYYPNGEHKEIILGLRDAEVLNANTREAENACAPYEVG